MGRLAIVFDFDFYCCFHYNLCMLTDIDQEVFKQIVQADDFISSLNLSTICNVSINTIRKTVDNINIFLCDKGCYIDSKISSGYRLQITDPDIAIEFIQQTLAEIDRFHYLDVNNLSSAYIILEKLLTTNDYISVEKLTNSMYCSKSTILRIMENVKLIAASYHLQLKSKRNYGFYIEGSEWMIRNCLIFLEKAAFHSNNAHLKYDSLDFKLMNNNELQTVIRDNIILSINKLSAKEIQLPSLNAHKIFDFIILSHTRKRFINNMGFTQEMIQKAKNLPTYSIARNIYENLPERFRQDSDEKDYVSLSALLACCMVIQDINVIPINELEKIKIETEEMIEFIQKYYDIKECFNDDFKRLFYCYYYSLGIKTTFNYVSDAEGLAPSIRLGLLTSDVCSYFALFYKLKHNITIKETDLIEAYYIFNFVLINSSATIDYKKTTAAIVARSGYYEAYNLRYRLLKIFPNRFERLDCFEHSEIYSNNIKDYDLLITNYRFNLNISLPINAKEIVIIGKNIHDPNSFSAINDYFKSLIITEAKKYLSEDNIIHSSFKSKEEVYQAIYQMHKDEVGSKDSFINDLRQRDSFISFEKENNIVMISPLAYKMNSSFIEVFINDQPITWKQNKDIIFIFYNRGTGSKKEITITSYLLKQFIHQHPFFINTMHNKTYKEIIRSFKF